jgi:branched-chain amino acid transport system ATP-binding protein
MLRVENICTYYGKVRALEDVSLEVREGQIVTLLGANGAGKTTLLKTISALLKPTSGKIVFEEEEINHLKPRHIIERGIVQVPEGRKIFPIMTVSENLEMGYYLRQDRKAIAKDIELVYRLFPLLKERRHQKAGTLSGGEQQMLAIGRGLMANPKLFLLDEPSLGLAPLLVEEIFEIVADIHKRGLPILLVEQNASMALEVADVAYVLEAGRVVKSGKARDLAQDEGIRKAYLGER